MKLNKNLIAISLALGLGALVAPTAQSAHSEQSSKGARFTATHPSHIEGERLTTMHDFKGLKKGDRVSSYCPMMNKTTVTTIRDVDSKGHAKLTQTRDGMNMDQCNIVLRRKTGSKEVQSMMVCPDGTLTPVECRKV